MKAFVLAVLLISFLVVPASAEEFSAPEVLDSAEEYMPEERNDFGKGLLELVCKAAEQLDPAIHQAISVCVGLIGIVMMVSLVESTGSGYPAAEFAGTIAVAAALFSNSNTLIRLAADVIYDMGEYGKLLFPVMTAAMAAQGGISTSAALYTGVSAFSSMLSMLIGSLFLPGIYLYLAVCTANAALAEDLLKNMRDLLKQLISWALKMLLTVFTTYISITGAVSGATDAAALKAARVSIATFVPVVGGILSDASEAVLVSVGVAKNAAGIYGIFAILAVFAKPFLQIGIQYLMLKTAALISGIFGSKRLSGLVGDFSGAMGLLLAMTGTNCVLLLISVICFMRGVG